MKYPNFREEKKLREIGYINIVGLDEAGRGALAGPVVACAVAIATAKIKNLKLKIKNPQIRDSKKLRPKKREEIYKIITNHPQIEWRIGRVSEKVIDKINIKNAAELAMEKAIKDLEKKYKIRKENFLIIDGNHLNSKKLKAKRHILIIKADEKVLSCALASIIAKVSRDRMMTRYHKKYPRYRFDLHKGYATRIHFEMIKKYGPCDIHRKSFSPCKDMLE